ncbi:MAG: PEP-CTERM sorting domain-containing protein [Methylococcaceae bacterium]
MLKKVFKYFLIVFCYWSFGFGSANAVLMDIDSEFGLSAISRDTVTGIDWLDLSVTAGNSVNQVNNALAGGFLAGWRRAEESEVCALAVAHADSSGCNSSTVESMDLSAVVNLGARLDARRFSGRIGSFGGLANLNIADVGVNHDDYFNIAFIFNTEFGFFDLDSQSVTVERDSPRNHFLVRATSVPEPATSVLLVSGFVTIFIVRHKKPS